MTDDPIDILLKNATIVYGSSGGAYKKLPPGKAEGLGCPGLRLYFAAMRIIIYGFDGP